MAVDLCSPEDRKNEAGSRSLYAIQQAITRTVTTNAMSTFHGRFEPGNALRPLHAHCRKHGGLTRHGRLPALCHHALARLVDRMPVCLDRHRSIVVENLRFRADLEYVAFLVNSLPVFISITGLKENRVIADTATWKPLRDSAE